MSFQYGYLKGTIRSVVGDTPGDGDAFPDIVHIPGLKAEVVPTPPRLTDSAAKITYFTAPIALGFDNTGVLRLKHHIDENGDATEDAVSEIPLIAQDDDDVNPSGGWTYQITITAPGIPTWSFPFRVNTGEVHDLSEIAPVAQSPGVITTRGPRGYSDYDLAVEQGYEGSVEDYLASLHGKDGAASMARGAATDLDTLVGAANAGAWYYAAGTPGAPTSGAGVVTAAASTQFSHTQQVATVEATGETFVRRASTGSRSPWRRLGLDEGAIRFDSQQTGITETQKYYAKLNSGVVFPGAFLGDLNTLYGYLKSGNYIVTGSGSANTPVSGQAGVLLVEASASNVNLTRQTYSLRDGRTYIRVYNDSTSAWTDWRRIDLPTTTANELRGTGSPQGVVAAPPGTYYTDTAGTLGAWRWLKRNGTGSSGWIVIYGDTGWRTIFKAVSNVVVLGEIPAGWGISNVGGNAEISVSRSNTTAHYAIDGLTCLTPSKLPAGFLPQARGGSGSPIITTIPINTAYPNSIRNARLTILGNGEFHPSVEPGDVIGQTNVSYPVVVSYPAKIEWPTSLPGTPA